MNDLLVKVLEEFFYDEFGNRLSGHPDELAERRELVLMLFPATKSWEVKESRRSGRGFNLPDGAWLFPGDDFFTMVITEEK